MTRTPKRRLTVRVRAALSALALLGCVGVAAAAVPPPLKWATAGGGAGWDDAGPSAVLADGSIIATGYMQPTAQFGPFTLASGRYRVGRADAEGTWQWVTPVLSSNDMRIRGIAAFPDGSSIVFGTALGTTTFGTHSITSARVCHFAARISSAGVWEWATQAQCTADQWDAFYFGTGSSTLTPLPDGSAAFVTTMEGSVTLGTYGTLTSTGGADLLTGRISGDGNWVWARREGGAGVQRGYDISATPDGSAIIVTGTTTGTADLAGQTLVSAGQGDIFVEKLDAPTGMAFWATIGGGTANDGYEAVANSAQADGGALVTAVFNGTATFGSTTLTSAGNSDIIVGRVTSAGAWDWAQRAGGANWEAFYAIQSQPDGSALMSGCTRSSFAIGADSITVPTGSQNAIFARLNADRSWAWATTATGSGNVNDCGVEIGATATGGILATGRFDHTATFGGSTALTATGGTSPDAFIACFGTASAACAAPMAPAPPAPAPAPPANPSPGVTPVGASSPVSETPVAASTDTAGATPQVLHGSSRRMRGGAIVTTGTPPASATRVVQVATPRGSQMARLAFGPHALTRVTTRCPITRSAGSRTYTCVVRLRSGAWTLTTRALAGSTVVAEALRRVRVGAATPVAVTG